jgi:glycosyltransferase involved in cell wall biosynthesis
MPHRNTERTMPEISTLKIWFIHDWLTGLRGGEKVLLELVRLFPNSRIATLLHLPGTTHPDLDSRVAQTSFLQKLPAAATHYRNYLPLFPRAVKSLTLDADCDLVISVSHAVAKGVTVPPGKPHVCYCNTPMRYIWGMEDHYLSKRSPKRLALKAATPALRRFDLQNDGVTQFVANSRTVADRIRRFYHRDAVVVYPGIDETYFTLPPASQPRDDYYFALSALVPYKRIDLAVQAFLQTPNRRLVIAGTGPEANKLRALAGNAPNITFLGRAPDEVVRTHYQRCRAFLFPGEEDFGLTPVEAQACGAPVIAYRAGGATETVLDTETGLFFDTQTSAALVAAIDRLESRLAAGQPFAPATLRANALRFTMAAFREGMLRVVQSVLPHS